MHSTLCTIYAAQILSAFEIQTNTKQRRRKILIDALFETQIRPQNHKIKRQISCGNVHLIKGHSAQLRFGLTDSGNVFG